MLCKPMHASLTPDVIMDGVQRSNQGLDNVGFCTSCGTEADGCEPDARDYDCAKCGGPFVYGAEELLMAIA